MKVASAEQRLMTLFRGLSRAHGTHGQEEQSSAETKVQIKKSARTVQEPVTLSLWEAHVRGEKALGIIPITEDGTCCFGAIDIDDYTADHVAVIAKLKKVSSYFIPCRTKSGGIHAYVFFHPPTPAATVVGQLKLIAKLIGYPSAEVFPKQTELTADGSGNWINMPYFGGDKTNRYALRPSGLGMSLQEFLDLAESLLAPGELVAPAAPASALQGFASGPPCLQTLSQTKIKSGEGVRNGVFDLGVLAKKMQPVGWEDILRGWNAEICEPPLSDGELQSIVRSLRKRDYLYKCKEAPIAAHCNKELCALRTFGIHKSKDISDVVSIKVFKTEPPLFYVQLQDGELVECNTQQLLNPEKFRACAVEQYHIVLPMHKVTDWGFHIGHLMETAEVIDMPASVSITGRLYELLEKFCFDRHSADTLNDMMRGKPWIDEENRRIYFRMQDFTDFLELYKFKELNRAQINLRIEQMGGRTEEMEVGGRKTGVCCLPTDRLAGRVHKAATPVREEMPI